MKAFPLALSLGLVAALATGCESTTTTRTSGRDNSTSVTTPSASTSTTTTTPGSSTSTTGMGASGSTPAMPNTAAPASSTASSTGR